VCFRGNVHFGSVSCALPAILIVSLLGTAWSWAGDDPLPKAETILDRYVDATGGKSAYAKLHNRVKKGTIEFVTAGIKAPMTVYEAEPSKQRIVMETQALGKIEEGTDGEVAWEMSMMTGPRVKEGEERDLTLRGAAFDSTVNWRKLYKKAECVGVEMFKGKPCYKVVLTPPTGEPETHLYEKESGLLVRMEATVQNPMGTIPLQVHVSDYKKVDGVLVPHAFGQVFAGQEQTVKINSVEHNVEIPTDRFELPAEVKSLVDKLKAGGK